MSSFIREVQKSFIEEGMMVISVKDHNGYVVFSGRGWSTEDIVAQMPTEIAQQLVTDGFIKQCHLPSRDEMLVRAVKQLSTVLAMYEPGDIDIKVESEDSREACGYQVGVFRKKMERII